MPELCHCGKPLHYPNPETQQEVQAIVDRMGSLVEVVGPDDRRWKVPRHYIALHGIKGSLLHTYGFEEVTGE